MMGEMVAWSVGLLFGTNLPCNGGRSKIASCRAESKQMVAKTVCVALPIIHVPQCGMQVDL